MDIKMIELSQKTVNFFPKSLYIFQNCICLQYFFSIYQKNMGCSTSDLEIEQVKDIHNDSISPIGRLSIQILKFELFAAFHHKFQKIIMIKFVMSNQEYVLIHDQLLKLKKCKKNNSIDFSYVINSLIKRYGRILIIQVIAQKNGQLKEITQIIDISPFINFQIQHQSQIKSYLNNQTKCFGSFDLSLCFSQQSSSNVYLELFPIFNSDAQKLDRIKFVLTAGQEYLQNTIKLESHYTKKFQYKLQIPHFLSQIKLIAQYIDKKQISCYSYFTIQTNIQTLFDEQMSQVLELIIGSQLIIGKIIVKQNLSEKNPQNTTNSTE